MYRHASLMSSVLRRWPFILRSGAGMLSLRFRSLSISSKKVFLDVDLHATPCLFVYPHFLCTSCVASWLFVPWKRCGRGVMSRSYLTSCPSEKITFRQTSTRKKRTRKSREHLVRRASDSQLFICWLTPANVFRTWQIPLAVTSSTWQTSQIDKLTWQVDLSPCSLAPLQITGQGKTWQVDLSSQLEQSTHHASVGSWDLKLRA